MPLVLIILIRMVLALIVWGGLRHLRQQSRSAWLPAWLQDDLLIGALILAAFALGVFLTYSFLATDGH
ncbi:MAG: hypothetical protein M1546_00175 [Chloroflexi bacterium]|nr:hypothetical protein [Chloroflexota bacterium]